MAFRPAEVDLIRLGAMQKTGGFLVEMRTAAVEALKEDMASTDHAAATPDEYVLRANAIGLGMADAGAFELADSVYAALDSTVQQHCADTSEKRHRGALLANRALLNVHLRRYDEAIPLFLYVAEKVDPETYGVAPEDSYANTLRRQALDEPALNLLLETWRYAQIPAAPPASLRELEELARFLGLARLVLYAALLFLRDNIRTGLKNANIYTALRILDSLRIFSFQLEEVAGRLVTVEFKQRGLDEPPAHTLVESLKALFCGPIRNTEWWPRLQAEIDANACRDATSRLSAQSQRLQQLVERQNSDWADIVVNSLAVLHLVRNITAHEIYPPAYVISAEANLEKVLGWLTMSGVALHREVFRA